MRDRYAWSCPCVAHDMDKYGAWSQSHWLSRCDMYEPPVRYSMHE